VGRDQYNPREGVQVSGQTAASNLARREGWVNERGVTARTTTPE